MPASINNNLMAANVANTLNSHYGKLATSVERLSSGLRINSAADDAAGLAIRELMRADVAALNQGVRNANDAISMLQVADGALGIIDEKLIRMKELAEQAATGTYNSTQRLMIHSEFVAMAEEIDRIARATDFNGIKLLDGSLSGEHDGSGLNATGKMKIHFGAANDSAEDYYYVEIGDCTLAGLGLRDEKNGKTRSAILIANTETKSSVPVTLNDIPQEYIKDFTIVPWLLFPGTTTKPGKITTIDNMKITQGEWYRQGIVNDHITIWTPWDISPESNFGFIIPKGTKNITINISGVTGPSSQGDNDIELFTMDGKHLVGTPGDDYVFKGGVSRGHHYDEKPTDIPIKGWLEDLGKGGIEERLPFTYAEYDDSQLNAGPTKYDGTTLAYSNYNGMTIGYSGDPDRHETPFNDGANKMSGPDYEVLTINEATEDLIFLMPGMSDGMFKAYWTPSANQPNPPDPPDPPNPPGPDVPTPDLPQGDIISIRTQDEAQQALERIDDAIVKKDKIRAHLGALQNRLENTVTNLTIQGENLQAAESRISDTDISAEMTTFVRNQVLTQSAVAMLGQANSYPHMLSGLITG